MSITVRRAQPTESERRAGKKGKVTGYTVRIETTESLSGKRERTTVGTFRTKQEAKTAQAKAIAERENGTLLKADSTTLNELMDIYVSRELPKTVRPENLNSYISTIDRHIRPALGAKQVRRLTVQEVDELLDAKSAAGLSSSSVTKIRMRLGSALDLAIRWQLVSRNVARDSKPPRLEYEPGKIWTPQQVSQFLDTARDDAWWPLWLLTAETGARQSELLGLAWQDVDLDAGTVRFGRQSVRLLRGRAIVKPGGKSKAANRTLKLTAATVAELRAYRLEWLEAKLKAGPEWNTDGLLFTNTTGGPINAATLRVRYYRLLEAAGVPRIKPHEIRKTAISLLIAAGADVKSVSQRAGHSKSAVTLDVYASSTEAAGEQLAALMAAVIPQTMERKSGIG